MLDDWCPRRVTEFDVKVYQACVPADHPLRLALELIRWNDFHEVLAGYYSADYGRPADDPVFRLKLEYLRYRDNLSDRQVIARAQTDMAYRYFLRMGVSDRLPDPSTLCYFRGRLGVKGTGRGKNSSKPANWRTRFFRTKIIPRTATARGARAMPRLVAANMERGTTATWSTS